MPAPAVPAPAPPVARKFCALRTGAAVAALALALVPLFREHQRTARQEQMEAWLRRDDVPVPPEMAREPDSGRIELRAARAALDAELEASRRGALDAEARRQGARHMTEAAGWAGAVLRDRPGAWDAALVLGAATYLAWAEGRDPRLFTAAPSWEAPLTAALRLAPQRPEPARFLAGAYMEVWQALSPAKRERARQLLATAFADPPTLAALAGSWLAIAGSREEAFAVIPPDPEAWGKIEEIYSRQHDWASFCAARQHREAALFAHLSARLAAAEERRARGDLGGARDIFLSVAALAPPGRRYLGLVRSALAQCPAGPVDKKTAARLAGHLSWSLERCLLDQCPLPERAIHRLAGFCRGLDPPREAMAILVSGDLAHAERMEHGADATASEAWAPYGLLKARTLAERGRIEEAQAALAQVHRSWLARPGYWRVKAALARAEGNSTATAEAARELSQLAAREWPASAWDFRGGVARLEMLTAQPAAGLRLTIDIAPKEGAAIEVRLDDLTLGAFPVAAGGTLALAAPLPAGLHLVEVETVAGGGSVLPGAVRLAERGDGDGNGGTAAEARSGGRADEDRQGEGVGRQGQAEVERLVDRHRGQGADGGEAGGAVLGAPAARQHGQKP
jgi:hypothetical protein